MREHAIPAAMCCFFCMPILVFLRGVCPQWKAALMDPRIVGGTFRLRFDSPEYLLRLITFFTHFRFRYFHYGDQGIFVRRAVFEQLGGFREIPIMEDLEFFKRLHGAGKVVLLPRPVTTSARRYL